MGQRLPSKCKTPLAYGYRPELDVTPVLKADGLQQYQELIRILRWVVELGQVDILMETSMMSTHLATPRWGHLEQVHQFLAISRNGQNESYYSTHSIRNWMRDQ